MQASHRGEMGGRHAGRRWREDRGTPTPLGVFDWPSQPWGEPWRDCVSCSHSRLEVWKYLGPRQARRFSEVKSQYLDSGDFPRVCLVQNPAFCGFSGGTTRVRWRGASYLGPSMTNTSAIWSRFQRLHTIDWKMLVWRRAARGGRSALLQPDNACSHRQWSMHAVGRQN